MNEIRPKNRPSYYNEDIVELNKIGLDKITIRKVDFSKCSIFETRFLTEKGEKTLRICKTKAFGEVWKLGSKIFLKVGAAPAKETISSKIKKLQQRSIIWQILCEF